MILSTLYNFFVKIFNYYFIWLSTRFYIFSLLHVSKKTHLYENKQKSNLDKILSKCYIKGRVLKGVFYDK